MVRLRDDEIKWLKNNYPQLNYDEKRSVIAGLFSINHAFKNVTIRAGFEIEVQLWKMYDRNVYPLVYNTDGKINRIAKRKKMPSQDLHVYKNNMLCLGLPERFREYYPNGFELPTFFKHLEEHLYWVAYYERYNKAPWNAELHGDDALVDYYIENYDIENLRKLFKKKKGKGIAKQKLRNYLSSEANIVLLKKMIYGNDRRDQNII